MCDSTVIDNCAIFNLFNARAWFEESMTLTNKSFRAVGRYYKSLESDFTEVYQNGTELLFADNWLRIDCFQTD